MSLNLTIIQEAAAALQANPYFSNISVLSANEGDFQFRIDDAIFKKTGIAVVLMTSKMNKPSANTQGGGSLYFEQILFQAMVFECIGLNRGNGGTGKWAPDVAETVSVVLHWYKPVNASECFICVQGPVMVPFKSDDDKAILVYGVTFETKGGIQIVPIIGTVATPTLTVVSNGNGTSTVTVACITNYAQVWFTTDGSFPSPLDASNNPRAPYTVPFTVATGTNVQARGWLPGYIPSLIAKTTV